jgi:hypothetical protein
MLHVVTQVFNNNPISGQIPGTKEHWPSSYWLVLGLPVVFYLACVGLLAFYGNSQEKNPFKYFFGSISNSLERLTGFAGWAMAGALTGLLALLVAAMGLYWDVAWHVDFGRDVGTLFTPAHVTILFGLGGLIFASAVTITFATLENAETKLRFGVLRVPWGGLLFGVMGILAVAAFPLDALWHATYGIDVTLWTPTHLQLITGGSLGVFAVMALLAEAWPYSKPNAHGRFWMAVAAGAVLTACSTYMGEFDFRVPQFQPVFLPILIMAAAGIALVFSRLVLGRWGAIKATIAFLVIRTYLSFLVASLHHEYARYPLFLPSAIAVELAAWWVGTHDRLKFGAVAGVLIGTLGLAGETLWISASGWFAPSPQLLGKTLELAPITAVAAAILGAGLGRMFHRDSKPMPVAALGLAGVVLIAALMIPLPRDVGNVVATIKDTPIGNGNNVNVTVSVQPPTAAQDAVFFGVTSWQGGGTKRIYLKETAPGSGTYTESAPIPVVGKWKSLLILIKGNWDMAAPIYMPIDPPLHAPELPAVPVRTIRMARNTVYLMRESHGGPAWPKELGYAGFAISTATFVALIAAATSDLDTEIDADEPRPSMFSGYGPPAKRTPTPATTWTPRTAEPARWNPGGLTGASRHY